LKFTAVSKAMAVVPTSILPWSVPCLFPCAPTWFFLQHFPLRPYKKIPFSQGIPTSPHLSLSF
jgi:hypothetical protein